MKKAHTVVVADADLEGESITQKLYRFCHKNSILLTWLILGLTYILAFSVRLFSVLRYESIIHEFDPYFNYRTTKYLVNEGFYAFHNWFDDAAWYPLGRIIGGTIYPGLMATAAFVYRVLHAVNLTVDIRNVCVLLAPWMASNTTLVTFGLAKEIKNTATGLVAAAMIAVVPGYISRSVAGSYDNECVAIFALVLTFYTWVKAVKNGSMFWGGMCALSYFYMVSAWGGYIFIINLIPIHVLVLLICGSYSSRIYVAYCSFYVLGTLMAMLIPFVGFQPVRSSEHMAAAGMFALLQLYGLFTYLRARVSLALNRQTILYAFSLALFILIGLISILRALGYVSSWTGRFFCLLDPTYAKEHIPIIASVSEHQPTTWGSFFFDLHIIVFLMPAGLYLSFRRLSDSDIFIILYGLFSVYFAGVMVRLMLVVSPAACVLAAIAISDIYETFMPVIIKMMKVGGPTLSTSTSTSSSSSSSSSTGGRRAKKGTDEDIEITTQIISTVIVIFLTYLLCAFHFHSTWVTSEAYSSPSIVLSAKQPDGSKVIFDDFREAYHWLSMNTPVSSKIMSWWDYGYQITAMANRTVLVDNNTWNNTHIATVGKMMSSTEEVAYPIMRSLDVDYVLVIFGGVLGYSSDDINKFLWMVRIGGGVYPEIVEKNYFTPKGEFRVDRDGSKTLLNSLMYKLCYYKFGQIQTEQGKPSGWDRVRSVEIGRKDFELEYLDEAFTSEHWLVRIYKVRNEENRPTDTQ
eukprot:TRINITY_DN417_c0_g5_i1.p1 TRINITY_DN417_c0_g5~~TRINITY_DN417_c0_g5_i1.p1  ORF type:complete len:744 (-),score=196.74 TRINITY_DN417_c0_g5_i1:248-2479(-)